MIYLLHLCFRSERPSLQEAKAFASAQRWWTWNDSRLRYFNKDSWVAFEVSVEPPDADVRDSKVWATVGMSLDSPRIFGVELAAGVAAIAGRFDSDVIDPQKSEVAAAFDAAAFLASWQAAHLNALRGLLLAADGGSPLQWDDAALERIWRWNYGRADRQDALGVDIFVPKIWLFTHREGELLSGLTWTDAIPALLPQVDVVMMFNHRINKEPLQLPAGDRTFHLWSEIEPYLDPYELDPPDSLPAARMFTPTAAKTAAMIEIFRQGPGFGDYQILPWSSVYEKGLLEAARDGGAAETGAFVYMKPPVLPAVPASIEDDFFDIPFAIVDVRAEEGCASFLLQTRSDGGPAGLWVDVHEQWEPDPEQGVLWGKVVFRTAGPESDRLLDVLAAGYRCEKPGSKMVPSIPFEAGILKGDPRKLELHYLKIKLHFASDDPASYAELYINLDLLGGAAEISEKDPEYRLPILRFLAG